MPSYITFLILVGVQVCGVCLLVCVCGYAVRACWGMLNTRAYTFTPRGSIGSCWPEAAGEAKMIHTPVDEFVRLSFSLMPTKSRLFLWQRTCKSLLEVQLFPLFSPLFSLFFFSFSFCPFTFFHFFLLLLTTVSPSPGPPSQFWRERQWPGSHATLWCNQREQVKEKKKTFNPKLKSIYILYSTHILSLVYCSFAASARSLMWVISVINRQLPYLEGIKPCCK